MGAKGIAAMGLGQRLFGKVVECSLTLGSMILRYLTLMPDVVK
jgi:hypothetical protein